MPYSYRIFVLLIAQLEDINALLSFHYVPLLLRLFWILSDTYQSKMKMRLLLPCVLSLIGGLVGITFAVTHDENFIPDAVLRVTEVERKQSCVPVKDILVVNGTSPGPKLRFTEGKTVWIRVYNDIPHQNLTMVSANII